MTVPPQKKLHRPILEMVREAKNDAVSFQHLKYALIQHFSLNETDLEERVPSGQNRFTNRVYWAVSYLRRASLLRSPSQARFLITDQGLQALATYDGDIGTGELKRLIELGGRTIPPEPGVVPEVEDVSGATPDEQLATLHQELDDKLADELLDAVLNLSPDRFEQLMVRLLEKMGYGKGQRVGGPGDGGIDGIIDQDLLGLEKVYVQVKRWEGSVGEPEIRNFSGSLQAKGASKGVFITTSTFAGRARETADRISAGPQFIRLVDGIELSRLMIRHDVGVVTEISYDVKKLDENYLGNEV